MRSNDRSNSHIIRVIEGFETVMFKSKFDSWPESSNATSSEDGKGKVAGQYFDFHIIVFLLPFSL